MQILAQHHFFFFLPEQELRLAQTENCMNTGFPSLKRSNGNVRLHTLVKLSGF